MFFLFVYENYFVFLRLLIFSLFIQNNNDMEVTVMKPKKTVERQNGALSFRQIRNKVGDGWAVIQDPEFNGCILLGGKLLYHSGDRKQALKKFGSCNERDVLFKYCGKPDPNTVFIL